jgi:hypothetical protein
LFHQIGHYGKRIDGDPISSNNPANDLPVVVANDVPS